MTSIIVVLPAPLGPMMQRSSPASMSSVSLLSALKPSKLTRDVVEIEDRAVRDVDARAGDAHGRAAGGRPRIGVGDSARCAASASCALARRVLARRASHASSPIDARAAGTA